MIHPDVLPSLRSALAALADPVDGWLLFDFRGINPIMAAVVGPEIVGSRRVVRLRPAGRGRRPRWCMRWTRSSGASGLRAGAGSCGFGGRSSRASCARWSAGKTVAMEYSPEGAVPYGDYVPAGTLEFVRAAGARPVSSAELVTRYCSVWTAADLASHQRAAAILADIARAAIAPDRRTRAGRRSRDRARGHALGARGVRPRGADHELTAERVATAPTRRARTTTRPPRAPGRSSGGELLLLDLWAQEPGGIYADQTWMAAIGAPVGARRRAVEHRARRARCGAGPPAAAARRGTARGRRGGRSGGARGHRRRGIRRPDRLPHGPFDRPRGAPRLRPDARRHRKLRLAPHPVRRGLLGGAGDLHPGGESVSGPR